MRLRWLIGAAMAALLCGCSPYRELKSGDLRGGFKDQEIAPGLFGILVKSDVSLWTNRDAVQETWAKRARELCAGEYVALALQDADDTLRPATGGEFRDHVTNRIGFALCARSTLSRQEAVEAIDRLGLLPAQRPSG